MAVVFRRFNRQEEKVEEIGVVIDREYYGEESNPAQALNFDFDGVEDALVDRFDGRFFNAVKVDDDEINIDEFRELS